MVFSFRFWWLCISKHTEGVPMAQLFATGIYTTIWTLPTEGNKYLPVPVQGCSSRRMATDCADSGTICGRRIFMRSAGMRHSAASRSNSPHCAARNSVGRVKRPAGPASKRRPAGNSRHRHLCPGAADRPFPASAQRHDALPGEGAGLPEDRRRCCASLAP